MTSVGHEKPVDRRKGIFSNYVSIMVSQTTELHFFATHGRKDAKQRNGISLQRR